MFVYTPSQREARLSIFSLTRPCSIPYLSLLTITNSILYVVHVLSRSWASLSLVRTAMNGRHGSTTSSVARLQRTCWKEWGWMEPFWWDRLDKTPPRQIMDLRLARRCGPSLSGNKLEYHLSTTNFLFLSVCVYKAAAEDNCICFSVGLRTIFAIVDLQRRTISLL